MRPSKPSRGSPSRSSRSCATASGASTFSPSSGTLQNPKFPSSHGLDRWFPISYFPFGFVAIRVCWGSTLTKVGRWGSVCGLSIMIWLSFRSSRSLIRCCMSFVILRSGHITLSFIGYGMSFGRYCLYAFGEWRVLSPLLIDWYDYVVFPFCHHIKNWFFPFELVGLITAYGKDANAICWWSLLNSVKRGKTICLILCAEGKGGVYFAFKYV